MNYKFIEMTLESGNILERKWKVTVLELKMHWKCTENELKSNWKKNLLRIKNITWN